MMPHSLIRSPRENRRTQLLSLGENKRPLSVSVTCVFIPVLSIVFAKSLRVFDEVQRYFVSFLFAISVLMESRGSSAATDLDSVQPCTQTRTRYQCRKKNKRDKNGKKRINEVVVFVHILFFLSRQI